MADLHNHSGGDMTKWYWQDGMDKMVSPVCGRQSYYLYSTIHSLSNVQVISHWLLQVLP